MPDTQIYVQDYVRTEKPRHQSSAVRRHAPKLGNPTPLGLSAFALSTMVVSFYNFNAFSITAPNMVVGVSLFTGGVVQFAAGMWEFKVGNTFGGTGFSAFGGFWASFGVIYIPAFGILDAYKDNDRELNNALAVYCLAWLIFTFIFTLACIRTNLGVLSAFICLTMTFGALTLYHFTITSFFVKLAGVLGIMTSSIVWYCMAATLLTPDLSPISLPLGDLSRKDN
ncbi:7752_t:CDS:2 [Funneliformis geosporum]|uniref:4297_t:CDS:1 n=1 Tax=Funneliformis geosporum TaxID=1117311 RepID=A0A9W4WTQ3_9GLOM|nr:7752_t:CDS:2 [Funneliformis geosporum]CAI2185234.1 4297_t:CDS:2 [Funneliformis geosporum]